jgi:hypothetical protein
LRAIIRDEEAAGSNPVTPTSTVRAPGCLHSLALGRVRNAIEWTSAPGWGRPSPAANWALVVERGGRPGHGFRLTPMGIFVGEVASPHQPAKLGVAVAELVERFEYIPRLLNRYEWADRGNSVTPVWSDDERT